LDTKLRMQLQPEDQGDRTSLFDGILIRPRRRHRDGIRDLADDTEVQWEGAAQSIGGTFTTAQHRQRELRRVPVGNRAGEMGARVPKAHHGLEAA
jgi:hypothetical protein